MTARLTGFEGVVARVAAEVVADVRVLTVRERALERDIPARGSVPSPRLQLSRTGNRPLNAAIHRVALTQARCDADALADLQRRSASGDTATEARPALKRRLSDIVYRALLADAPAAHATCLDEAA